MLNNSEEKFRIIFENSAVAITVADDKERIVSWNKFAEQLLEMTHDDLYMKPVSSLYSEEEWKRIRSLNIRKDGLRQNVKTVITKKDGRPLDVEISITVLKDSNNNISGSIGIIKDISVYKKFEEKLNEKARKSDVIFRLMQSLTTDLQPAEMLELIIEAAGSIVKADTVSIVLLDEHQKEVKKVSAIKSTDEHAPTKYVLHPSLDENASITEWVIENKKPLMLFGKTKNDKRFKNIECREDIKCSINVPIMYKDSVKGTINLNIIDSDIIFEAEDLDVAIALASHAAIALENSGSYKSMKDLYINELKSSNNELQKTNIELNETRNQLVQTGKMAAIGQLASGVAHEINNPLSGVLGNIQIIKMELKSGGKVDDLDELLTVIEESARRCKSITQQLLDFSRTKKDVFEAFDIHKSLNSTITLVGYGLKNSGIEIIKKFTNDIPMVLGNQNEIQQISLNLISNAKWAIEKKSKEGGPLTIATRKIDDKFIEVSFTDKGIGMSDETIQRIFEAFYTTKEVGEGTGLGLSICYDIMKKHNGDLTVESQEGAGTTFYIKIPIAMKANITNPFK